MEAYVLVLYLAASAGNPSIPPEVVRFPTEAACQQAKTRAKQSGVAWRAYCIAESQRPQVLAH